MSQHNQWKLSLVATLFSVVATIAVCIFSYPYAHAWFARVRAREEHNNVYRENPLALPDTGLETSSQPGFPWWALTVSVSIIVTAILIGNFIHRNTLFYATQALSRSTAQLSYTYAERLADKHDRGTGTKRRFDVMSYRLAHVAIALRSVSDILDKARAGTQAGIPDLSTLPPVPDEPTEYLALPPQVDASGKYLSIPPRIPMPTVVLDDSSEEDTGK